MSKKPEDNESDAEVEEENAEMPSTISEERAEEVWLFRYRTIRSMSESFSGRTSRERQPLRLACVGQDRHHHRAWSGYHGPTQATDISEQ